MKWLDRLITGLRQPQTPDFFFFCQRIWFIDYCQGVNRISTNIIKNASKINCLRVTNTRIQKKSFYCFIGVIRQKMSVVLDLSETKWSARFDRSLSQLLQSQNSHLTLFNLVLKSYFVSCFKTCNIKFTRFSHPSIMGHFCVIYEYSYTFWKKFQV